VNHPTLFKKTSTGAIQSWKVAVDGADVVSTYGQVGGAMQTARVTCVVKNPGKKNERSPEAQAIAEAAAQWTKQLKKGYVQSIADAEAGVTDAIITGGILPMLAHKFSEHADKIEFPCYVQPKLDGHRCIAMVAESGVTLWSRTRKPIRSMPHIIAAIESLNLAPGTVLDGELYSHTHRAAFSKLTSLIRGSSPKPEGAIVEYHIYDLPSYAGSTFAERTATLAKALAATDDASPPSPLVYVDTALVDDEIDLQVAFRAYLAQGYEGVMARNAPSKYENKRSYGLQKVKEFKEGDFTVVGIEEGKGKLAGHVGAFVFKAENGEEFRAKMKGDTALLKGYFENPDSVMGRVVEVHYFELSEYGIPRFPVAHRFKEEV